MISIAITYSNGKGHEELQGIGVLEYWSDGVAGEDQYWLWPEARIYLNL